MTGFSCDHNGAPYSDCEDCRRDYQDSVDSVMDLAVLAAHYLIRSSIPNQQELGRVLLIAIQDAAGPAHCRYCGSTDPESSPYHQNRCPGGRR
jgi:hypothetical protein